MRKISIVLSMLCLCILSLQAFAYDMGPSVDKLSAHEKMLWEAIKNGDMKAFSDGTAAEHIAQAHEACPLLRQHRRP